MAVGSHGFVVVLTTPDVGKVNIAVDRVPAEFREALRQGINATLLDAERFTRLRLTGDVLHVGMGALRASVRMRPMEVGASGGDIEVGSGIEYARAHEYGVPRGSVIIVPKTKKFLHFFVGEKEIFTKRVRMFLPKRPYFAPSIREALKLLPGHVGYWLRKLITIGGVPGAATQ